ncbi:MAG: methyltransferase domain-containing protein [Ignavibacteriae bacterium]|nr:methyltransferase domain-containing protein [Ignavibacteriota bacterium]
MEKPLTRVKKPPDKKPQEVQNTASSVHCWCGNERLERFSPEYMRCPVCETLVLERWPPPKTFRVVDDRRDFYGQTYYQSHLTGDYNYPSIEERSRTDLPERCLHWLKYALKYKLPPGKALELGCAHGGFVAMLKWAGFDAAGLEMSPWLVEFARSTFGIPMFLGPVEEQKIESRSIDLIALMDVLEHLPDPTRTMGYCLSLLKANGILLIQTPHYPEGKKYDAMVKENDPFLIQLKSTEHLYLFSKSSVREFFRRLGAKYIEFEPAIFFQYDMFFAVGAKQLLESPDNRVVDVLSKKPDSRLIQALLDIDSRFTSQRGDTDALRTERDRLQSLYDELLANRDVHREAYEKMEKERDHYQQLYDDTLKDRDALRDAYEKMEKERDKYQVLYNETLENRNFYQQAYDSVVKERDHFQKLYNDTLENRDYYRKAYEAMEDDRDRWQNLYNAKHQEHEKMREELGREIRRIGDELQSEHASRIFLLEHPMGYIGELFRFIMKKRRGDLRDKN